MERKPRPTHCCSCMLLLLILVLISLVLIFSVCSVTIAEHKSGNFLVDVATIHQSRLLGGKLGVSLWTENLDTWTDTLTSSSQHTLTDSDGHSDGGQTYKSWNRGLNTHSTLNTSKNCSLLFSGDKEEGERIREENEKHPLEILPDSFFFNKTSSCEWVKDEFLDNFYVSSEEREFPLAFSISVYSSPQQILRFLKAIYRPHNAYCIHYDDKSSVEVKRIFNNLVNCLPNIFVPTEIEKVFRGWHSVVDAQVHCFEQLLSIHEQYPWQYVTTLCGKELPLRTNQEMVQIFKSLNGTSAVKASMLPKWETSYIKYRWELDPNRQAKSNEEQVFKTPIKNGPVPLNLTVYKSLAYYGLSLKFVHFLLYDEKVAVLRKYLEHTRVPEEHFVPTVFKMTGVPGGYNEDYKERIPIVSGVIWLSAALGREKNWKTYCNGWNIHKVCVCNSADLYRLNYQPHTLSIKSGKGETLFHNKYFLELDHTIIECMEEEIVRRNRNEYFKDLQTHSS